jgi:hypothetical protein
VQLFANLLSINMVSLMKDRHTLRGFIDGGPMQTFWELIGLISTHQVCIVESIPKIVGHSRIQLHTASYSKNLG